MTQVRISNTNTKKTIVVSEDKTIREIFSIAEVNMGRGLVMLNGSTIEGEELDYALSDFGIDNDSISLTAIVKADNAKL